MVSIVEGDSIPLAGLFVPAEELMSSALAKRSCINVCSCAYTDDKLALRKESVLASRAVKLAV